MDVYATEMPLSISSPLLYFQLCSFFPQSQLKVEINHK